MTSETRSKLLKIRITDKEQAQLASMAKSHGLVVSDYVRSVLFVATSDVKSVATKSPAVQTVATKIITTPSQARKVAASLPVKTAKLPAMESVSMSMSDAKALRLQQFLARQ